MSLFPLIDAPDSSAMSAALPLAREVAWDFVQDQPIWRSGRPVYMTGADAVLVWAWNCIHTERFAHDVFTSDYGQDLSGLIGQPYGDEVHPKAPGGIAGKPIHHCRRSGERPI